jgi:hypothetical protein
MASLAESNPYLRDPEERQRRLVESAWESSVFAGAHGLPRPPKRRRPQRSARRTASSKKRASGK